MARDKNYFSLQFVGTISISAFLWPITGAVAILSKGQNTVIH